MSFTSEVFETSASAIPPYWHWYHLVEPLGIEPSYHALQARAMTTLAQVPLFNRLH